jgi:hypothetical protein
VQKGTFKDDEICSSEQALPPERHYKPGVGCGRCAATAQACLGLKDGMFYVGRFRTI